MHKTCGWLFVKWLYISLFVCLSFEQLHNIMFEN